MESEELTTIDDEELDEVSGGFCGLGLAIFTGVVIGVGMLHIGADILAYSALKQLRPNK